MPLAMDPEATFRIVLKSDRTRSPEPAFVYRHLSARQSRRIEQEWFALRDGADPASAWGVIEAAATAGMVGWEHITDESGRPVPFDPARLADICTDAEIAELIGAVIEARRPAPGDLKNSVSPSPSPAGGSDDAATAPAQAGV